MGVRQCTKCKETKEFSEFPKQKGGKFGIRPSCKVCLNRHAKEYRDRDKETYLEQRKRWRQKNPEAYRAANKKWLEDGSNRERMKTWQRHYSVLREMAEKNATPSWLTEEDKQHIRCIYSVSAMRNRESDTVWEVDHIVPIKGKTVCGLHVPWNLRVITRAENRSKLNKLVP